MAKLKRLISKLTDVDEKYRELYVPSEDGSSFVLDDEEGEFKARIDEFRTNNRKLHNERDELAKKLTDFKDIDPAKYHEAQKAMAQLDLMEDSELIKAGKIDEVISKRTRAMTQDNERQLASKDTLIKNAQDETAKLRKRLGHTLIDATVQGTIARIGRLRPGADADVLNRARQIWDIDANGDPVAMDPQKREKIFGKSGDPLKIEEWAQSLLTDAPHLFEPAQGSGGAGGRRSDAGGRVTTIASNDALAFGNNLAAIVKGTVRTTESQ